MESQGTAVTELCWCKLFPLDRFDESVSWKIPVDGALIQILPMP